MTDRTIRISVDPSGSNAELRTLERNLNNVEDASGRVDKQNTILGASYKQLTGIIAGVGIAEGIRAVVSEVRALERANRQLSAFSNNVGQENEYLASTADRLSTDYKALSGNYGQFLLLQKSGISTQDESRKLLEGFSASAQVTGVATDALNRSLAGFFQSAAAGRDAAIQMDEYKQIVENSAVAQLALADGLGITTGELRSQAKAGQLTNDQLITGLIKGFDAYTAKAEDSANSVDATLIRTSNQYTEIVKKFQEPVASGLSAGAALAENALRNINENFSSYAKAAEVAAVATAAVFGAKAAGEVLTFGKAVVSTVVTAVARQEQLTRSLATRAERQALYRAQSIKSAADEALAEAALSKQVAAGNVVRKTAAAVEIESALLSAERVALTRQEILAETQSATAIARTSQIEAARTAARAQQGAISASTNQVRLRHAQALEAASLAEAAATNALSAAVSAEVAAKTGVTTANAKAEVQSRRLAQAKINEAKAVTASRAAITAEGAAYSQANAARAAAIAATNTLAASTAAATSSTTRQTIALRVNAVAATAAAAATRAAASAYALIGGPLGVALIASFAIYKVVTAETDGEKSARSLSVALKALAKDYGANAEAALSAANATAEAETANLNALRTRFDELTARQEQLRRSATGGREFAANVTVLASLREEIDRNSASVDRLRGNTNLLARGKALESYYEGLEVKAASAARGVGGSSAAIQAALDKILPDDKKRREIQALKAELDTLFDGDLDNAKYIEASAALNNQLASLNKLTEAERERAAALDQVQESFNGLTDSFLSEREKLAAELQSGNEIIDLNVRINPSFSENDGESARVRLKERINEQLKELDDAEINDRRIGFERRRAIAQQAHDAAIAQETANRQALIEARSVIDPAGVEQERFAEDNAALEAQNQFKLISNNEFQERRAARLITHLDSVSSIEQDKSQQVLDAAINAGVDRESAEQAHQTRLVEIARFGSVVDELRQQLADGQITRAEFHAKVEQAETEHQQRLAGIRTGFSLADRDTQISVGNQLLDLYEARLNRQQSIATAAARSLFDQARDATGVEKEELLERARNAEDQARRRFESEKRSNIARARIAQALAVVQAWSTGVTIFDKIANAALVGIQTQSAIDSINSQQFNGGSSLNTATSGGSSSSSSTSSTGTSDGGLNEAQPINITFVLDDNLINQGALEAMSVNAVASATQSRDLVYDDSAGFYTTNNEAAA